MVDKWSWDTADCPVMDAQLLGAIATSLAATVPATTLERPVGDHRSWERLLATDAYDAWLIRWPAGTSVGPHDHGGSAGAFTVVAGELVEIVSDPSGSTRVMTLGPGAQRGFGPDLVPRRGQRRSARRDQRPRLLAADHHHDVVRVDADDQ